LSAGASLTPSPVIATTSPSSWRSETMRILSAGSARENMRDSLRERIFRSSASDIFAISSQTYTFCCSFFA
jgi:hypothetical protein